jgi:CheY-like chemotaxis protein
MSRVLVIDDDPGVRESMRRMLSQAGYTVRVAETGEEGFELARDGAFDVVLSDMRMPCQGSTCCASCATCGSTPPSSS